MVAHRRRPTPAEPNRSGAHFLRRDVAADLVAASGVGASDLVFDLGAGAGALTVPLAATGARVVAVERDAQLARRLARRLADAPNVTVVRADLRTVDLPRRTFRVVANLPFATTTAVVHRLVDPAGTRLDAADLVLQRQAAQRLAAWAATPAGAWWGARYRLSVGRTLSPTCFHPPPSVGAAVLRIRRVRLPPGAEATLARILRERARAPHRPVRAVLAGRLGAGQLRALGIEPGTASGLVAPVAWAAVAAALAATRS